MIFNSFQFAAFFTIVFLLHLALGRRLRNLMLLAASCLFYAAWDWRFLLLLGLSVTTDYYCALGMHATEQEDKRKRLLYMSLVVNLSALCFFKYFNFFSGSLAALLVFFGIDAPPFALHVVLPLGISFYTFRTLSYTLDVYNGKAEPSRRYTDYALFVVFFPLLVSGPIVRAVDLLPQIDSERRIGVAQVLEGCHLIFWGLFQKMFVADNLARLVDPVFSSAPPYKGVSVAVAIYAFAFQIYFDFAGYSNIARGIGKLLGFDIMFNFNLPYFSTNAAGFWERWHISLSTWLRDYLFFPLALAWRGCGRWSPALAALATFTLCGLWHGAAWTFILWGAYQGLLVAGYRSLKPWLDRIPGPRGGVAGSITFFLRAILFFQVVCLGWLLFRARSTEQAFAMLQGLLFNFHVGEGQWLLPVWKKLAFFIWIPLAVELLQYRKKDLLAVHKSPLLVQLPFYLICSCLLLIFGVKEAQEFIYFQF